MRLILAMLLLAPAVVWADAEDDAAMLRGTLELQRMEAADRAFWAEQAAEDADRARIREMRQETDELRNIDRDLQRIDRQLEDDE